MNIHDEITIPGQEANHGEVPAWLADSPVWPAVKAQTGVGQISSTPVLSMSGDMACLAAAAIANLISIAMLRQWAREAGHP